ncbi:ACP phosphodiesterase [Compostibacter hankyongensis]|uniref:ACP phosphodiesterase n=1 Tax=Compostibacter hankyongensis TaxID=1007089 RepID=A0ABP8FT37_9BACT
MNYLAHAFLSFGQPDILAGNMIADFVKGRRMYAYPAGILKGIRLHRAIDDFTDCHPVTREAKSFFRTACGLYSGVFTDVVYDHFLANDPRYFGKEALQQFSQDTYRSLQTYEAVFPEGFGTLFSYMRRHDWLYSYLGWDGVERAFNGIYRRARYLSADAGALTAFRTHYEALSDCYADFIPEVMQFAESYPQPPEGGVTVKDEG